MDGTLVDTEPLWWVASQEVIRDLGGVWTDEDCRRLIGSALDHSVAEWMKAVPPGRISADDLAAAIFGRLQVGLTEGVAFMPGVLDDLEHLREAGIPCALVTASYRSMVDALLTHLPPDTFATTVAGDEVVRGKPDPEPYLTAARHLDVDPAHCVVIEDSIGGAASGNAAGAVVLVVASPGVDVPEAPRRHRRPDLVGLDVAELSGLVASTSR